jgi:ATP-dependent Clp protease ATP-binding subunit ClpC
VGYEEGGQLTEAVRRKPFSVILFDEVEKAHEQVFDIFLQIMEEGKLTDSMGRVVDFKNTIVVMTSNIGSQLIQNKSPLGFGNSASSQDIMETQINDELGKHFKPEFLNRLDDKIIFTQLTRDELRQVLHLEVAKVQKLLANQKITISLTPAAEDFLLEKGWNPEMGARPLRRAVANHIEDTIADEILRNPDVKDFQLDVSSDHDSLIVI